MAFDIATTLPAANAGAQTPSGETAILATLTYRSRAVTPLSELELHRLGKAAQARNRSEAVTGLMVYAEGWIFQQLEGPQAGLARIWESIRRDARHGEIQVLGDAPTPTRQFPDWDLMLSIHGAEAGHASPPAKAPELIARLCRGERPDDLPVSSWRRRAAEPLQALALVRAADALAGSRASLAELISAVVVPRLCATAPALRLPPASPAARLAVLLTAVDAEAALTFARTMQAAAGVSLDAVALDLLEPAARCLGDLWQTDDCSELDVTLGLIRLQAIMRALGADAPRLTTLCAPAVIVVPPPGEVHLLGAAFDAELLWHAGWEPRIDFPASSDALDALLAASWVDVLDLSLSTSFRREHRLAQLRRTIASARLASLNPGLVVVVSGRAFGTAGESPAGLGRAHEVGADASFSSSSQAEATILGALNRPAMGFQSAQRA